MEQQETIAVTTDAEQPISEQTRVERFVLRPFAEGDGWKLYNADCREVVREIGPIDTVITDPPYPNRPSDTVSTRDIGERLVEPHFENGIKAAIELLTMRLARQWMIFWSEMERPPCTEPMVAVHIWHRNNTNRPNNYEPIYHFASDGEKRASRLLSYPVIYPGLTGCREATGHPTQKNEKLMRRLLEIAQPKGLVFDPFAGSGTTLRAAVDSGCEVVGCEIDERWCEKAANRMRQRNLF